MDIVERYEYIVKQANPAMLAALMTARGTIGGSVAPPAEPGPSWLSRGYRGAGDLASWTASRNYDPRVDNPPLSYRLGKSIADFFLPKVYDPDDLGPYEEYSAYLKDTERAEMLLREAAKLRRRARLEELKREEEEKGKARASKSRYF